MGLPSHPDAQLDVQSTATHVLDVFENMVKAEITGCEPVYDEQLTFETGIKEFLQKNNFNDQARTDFPVFLYNRSQLRWPKVAPSRRLNYLNGKLAVGDEAVMYKAMHGEFDIQFMFLCRSVETQERFEVAYQSETGISANRAIELDMKTPLGVFNYFLTYSELTNKAINYEGAAYTAVMGQITVRGFYFTFVGKTNLIKIINLRIFGKALPGPVGDVSGLLASFTLTSV